MTEAEALAHDDHALAGHVASTTGELLVALIRSPVQERRWGGLEYEGDRRAHHHIVDALARHRPDDVVLSEEGRDDPRRLDTDRVWIVDPLDGSSDYGYSAHWSVHVALVVDGEPRAAAVAVPGWDTTWVTDPAPAPVCYLESACTAYAESAAFDGYDKVRTAFDMSSMGTMSKLKMKYDFVLNSAQ